MLEVINLKLVFAKRGCAHFAKRSEAHAKREVRAADYTSSSRSLRGPSGQARDPGACRGRRRLGAGQPCPGARQVHGLVRARFPAGCIAAMATSTSARHGARCNQRITAAHVKGDPALNKAAVALANKNARILWTVMTKGQAFDSTTRKRDSA